MEQSKWTRDPQRMPDQARLPTIRMIQNGLDPNKVRTACISAGNNMELPVTTVR
jgi:hypothetical protein